MAIRIKIVDEPPFIRVKGLNGGGGGKDFKSIEVILNAKCSSKTPIEVSFTSTSNYGWSVIRSQEELDKINKLVGQTLNTSYASYERGFGQLTYNPYFDYTVTAIYSDDGVTEIKDVPLNYFSVYPQGSAPNPSGYYAWHCCIVKSSNSITTPVTAYKIKVSLKPEYVGQLDEFYFTNEGSKETSDTTIKNSINYIAYDKDGNTFTYDADKIYNVVQFRKYDGTVERSNGAKFVKKSSSDDTLSITPNGNKAVFKCYALIEDNFVTADWF